MYICSFCMKYMCDSYKSSKWGVQTEPLGIHPAKHPFLTEILLTDRNKKVFPPQKKILYEALMCVRACTCVTKLISLFRCDLRPPMRLFLHTVPHFTVNVLVGSVLLV